MGKISSNKIGSKPTYTVTKYNSKGEKIKEVKKVLNLDKMKKSTPYFADPFIVPRVEQYLEENKDKLKVDIDEMVDYLRTTYKDDYLKKKKAPFKANVEKAFAAVLKKHELKDDLGTDSDDTLDEEEDEDDEGMSDLDDEGEEGELGELGEEEEGELGELGEIDDMDTDTEQPHIRSNSINNTITSMYKADKPLAQRNGSQELINISSDEEDKDKDRQRISQKPGPRCSKVPPGRLTVLQKKPDAQQNQVYQKKIQNLNSCPPQSELAKNIAATLTARKPPIVGSPFAHHHQAGPSIAVKQQMIRSRRFAVTLTSGLTTRFEDVGGCSKILQEVTQLVIHLQHPEIFLTLGISPPRGFLLHGPPGTGKTHLVHAIAGELKVPLLKVAAPQLVSGLSGGSEERIRELFDQAVALSPCIVFLDEVDAITPNRDTAHREMERRIVAQLLSSLDELGKTPHGNGVLVIGATNRPDSIDPALRRAGRFDREICLGIPDREARRDILHLLSAKLRLAPSVSLDNIAMATPGYVGADLKALLTEAAMAAVSRLIKEKIKNDKEHENDVQEVTKDVQMEDVTANEPITTPGVSDRIPTIDAKVIPLTCENFLGEPAPKKRKTDEGVEGDDDPDDPPPATAEVPPTMTDIPPTTAEVPPTTADGDQCSKTDVNLESEDPKVQVIEKPAPEETKATEDISKEIVEDKIEEDVIVEVEINKLLNEKQRHLSEKKKEINLLSNNWKITRKQLQSLFIDEIDFAVAMKKVQPSAKREGFATVPDVTWDDIGSLKDIRQELKMTIMAPVQYPEAFVTLGLNVSSGVLLCGPPGCGKTLLAKAVANEAGINFISVKGPELLNMYVGESERAVRQCFLRARNSQPCVIFFDELDALCPKRSDFGDGGASTRVVNQLLTEMDGVESRTGVFLMAATNRPDIIDPAVLRPGRLDKILYVGLPSPSGRVDILRALTKNGTKPELADDVSLEAVGQSYHCNGYTGADLSSLVREAGIESLKEYVERGAEGPLKVASRHFTAALLKIRPSVSEKDQKHYEELRLQYAATPSVINMEVSE